jgi:hypothetical protein
VLGPALALALMLPPSGAGEGGANLAQALAEQRALAQQRPNEAGVWNDLGNLLALEGDLDDAELAYVRALEIDPSSATARFNLALLHQQSGDLEGASGDYRAVLEIDPAHAWAHYQLGVVRERLGQRQEALASYAEAFTLDPELLFAETNPHIIENRLVTEALLLARRGSRSGPPTPRAYDEPRRIQSLLAPSPVPSELGAEPVPEQPAGDSAEEPPGDPSRPWAPPPVPATPRPIPGRMEAEPPPGSASAQAAPGDRVLDSTDLRGGVRNQVQGGEAMPAAPGTRGRGATITPAGRRGLHQPPDDRAWSSFEAGQRSTGSLDWQLAPAPETAVPAR